MARLVDPIDIGSHRSPSRAVFGPHETNLGRGRALSERHVAYYARRAAGGAGVIVVETASVHASDWPYERAPLVSECARGWLAIAEACRPFETVVLAGIGHCGGQGSSAWSQSVLWAPSAVADAATREMPTAMELEDLEAVVGSFEEAAAAARASGLAGVEVDAGPRSLLRQFHSGLTNHRGDRYGTDRLAFTREVLAATRRGVGGDGLLAVRLSCDELAPWAGVTPDQAADHVDELADVVDLLVVVRGGPYSVDAYRPRAHAGAGFNLGLTGSMRAVAAGRALVVLQGSVVEPAMADAALEEGVADLVEMTRAQIADPRLVGLVRAGGAERVRPCVLCNQACTVRDARNPLVSCIGEPRSGYETTEPDPEAGTDPAPRRVLVVGGGPAGLECARVLASRGHDVHLVEATERLGGALARAAVGPSQERLSLLTGWLEAECRRLGVDVELGRRVGPGDVGDAEAAGWAVVLATGSRPATGHVHALELLERGPGALGEGPYVVDDPVGGPIGVAVAEWLAAEGRQVAIVTQDQVAGSGLARTGDLAAANTRLQRAGVRRELRCRVVASEPGTSRPGEVVVEDVWTGERRAVACAVLVDAGHRLAEDELAAGHPRAARAGDCVAPRTALEAILEGRRRALEVGSGHARAPSPPPACPGAPR